MENLNSLIEKYGLSSNFNSAAAKVENGAKFNGKVYSKRDGRSRMVLSLYLDGEYTHLGSVCNEDVKELKGFFNTTTKTNPTPKNSSNFGTIEWWANGMIGE